MHQEKENNVVMCAEMITLAVAPSVCDLRQCVSLLGGQSLGRVASFNEIFSVLALGTTFSSSAKEGTSKLASVHCNRNVRLMIPIKNKSHCPIKSFGNIMKMKKPFGKGKTTTILYAFEIKLKALPEVRAVASFEARLNIISQTLTLQNENE